MYTTIKAIFATLQGMYYKFIFDLPVNNLTNEVKLKVLKAKGITKGNDFLIGTGLFVKGTVLLGTGLSLNRNVMIASSGGIPIVIGDYCLIGPNVVIRNANHGFRDIEKPMRFQPNEILPIIIEDDVWIAANCVILAGARIGKGSIVAAGAVVTKGEIPPYSIVGGVPAKVIGSRGAIDD